jgi:preprotein translocase subunit SecF
MLWGIVIGTYSSLFIAAPLLFYIRPKRGTEAKKPGEPAVGAEPAT